MGVGDLYHSTAALSPGMTWYQLDGRLGGSQGQSGQVGIISLLPGFDPQTAQPVPSHYTNYNIPVHSAIHEDRQTSPTGKNPSTHYRRGKSLALAGSPARSPVTMQTTLSWLLNTVDNICSIHAQTVAYF
jgi:hypothetical protein